MEFDDVKREFKNDPTKLAAMCGLTLLGVAALVNAVNGVAATVTYAREVNYRIKNKK